MNEYEEQDLVRRAATGDVQAVRALVEALTPDAFRVAVAVLGAKHPDLEDAVQLGVLGVMKQLKTFRHETSFHCYALLIVSRAATALRRKNRRGAEITQKYRANEGLEEPDEVADGAPDPADQGLRRLMTDLLATLPDAQAETFLLRVVLEYKLDEIASLTGVPVNTVRSRVRLAREALRRRIESDPRLRGLASEGRLSGTTKGRPDDE